MNLKIIANPVAGRGRVQENLPRVREILGSNGDFFHLETTTRPGEATDIAYSAAQNGFEAVVAMGGDGTVREVLTGLSETETPLGIIPSGNGNDLARSLDIPLDVVQATRLLSTASPKLIDIGADYSMKFGGVLGIGFPADVMEMTNQTTNSFLKGSPAIAVSVLRQLVQLRSRHLEMELDGQKKVVDAVAIFIMNINYTGGGLHINPGGELDDGQFDIIVVKDISKLDLLYHLPRVYWKDLPDHPKVEVCRARSISVKSEKALPKMYDGDVMGRTPLEVEVLPEELSVLVA